MLRHVPHSEIDKDRWDAMVETSPRPSLYGMSWYLDAFGPWDAVVLDAYAGGMAFHHERKGRLFTLLRQAPFVQRYDWFGSEVDAQELWDVLSGLGDKLHLNTDRLLSETHGNQRLNLFLSLDRPYDQIAEGYHKTLRKNLRRAKELGMQVRRAENPSKVIDLYRMRYGDQNPQLKDEHYAQLTGLVGHLMPKGNALILEVYLQEDLLAACLFMVYTGRMHYVLGAPTDRGRRLNALSICLDHLIRTHADSEAVLD